MINNSKAAFDYKSSIINQQENSTAFKNSTAQETSQSPTNTTSYSTAAKSVPKPVFPKKDQAIVFHSEESLKLLDYVKAVGDIVGPKNISFASRISNNRICIYLSNRELVDKLIAAHQVISIKDMDLNIRRLVSPTKRIIISNISPSIPHDIAETALKNLNLNLASPISFLKAGIPGDEYGHILSFRRQVYIFTPTENFELQTSLLIPYEGNEYRIFLSTDKMECFLCKQTGHIASNCPNPPSSMLALDNIVAQPPSEVTPVNTDAQSFGNIPVDNPSQKRHHSDTLTSSQQSVSQSEGAASMPPPDGTADMPPPDGAAKEQKHIKQCKKKRKTEKHLQSILSDHTKAILKERYQSTPEEFILPVDNFIAFLENTYDNCNPYQEALKFTNDVKTLLANMYTIYPFLKERSIKNRFTRLTKKIKAHFKSEEMEIGSISSVLSQSSLDLCEDDIHSDDSRQSQKSTF